MFPYGEKIKNDAVKIMIKLKQKLEFDRQTWRMFRCVVLENNNIQFRLSTTHKHGSLGMETLKDI